MRMDWRTGKSGSRTTWRNAVSNTVIVTLPNYAIREEAKILSTAGYHKGEMLLKLQA